GIECAVTGPDVGGLDVEPPHARLRKSHLREVSDRGRSLAAADRVRKTAPMPRRRALRRNRVRVPVLESRVEIEGRRRGVRVSRIFATQARVEAERPAAVDADDAKRPGAANAAIRVAD